MRTIQVPSKNAAREERGFVYVAVNTGSEEMAARSARSLREHVNGAHITLFTDQPGRPDVFDFIAPIPSCSDVPEFSGMPQYPCQGIVAKLTYFIRAPYRQVVYLDIDTRVAGNISDLFELVESPYDLDFASRIYEAHFPIAKEVSGLVIPHCLPRFNTGVMVFQKNEAVMRFYERAWKYALECNGNMWTEEPYITAAAFTTPGLRTSSLPEEYNTRFIFPFILRHATKVIHGRWHDGQYDDLIRKINEKDGTYRVMYTDKMIATHKPIKGFERC